MSKRLLAGVLCLLLAAGLCACRGGDEPPAETQAAKDSYGVGEAATWNGVTATLTQVEVSQGSDAGQPEAGKVFLLCHFEITNNSDKDLTLSSVLSFKAYVDGAVTTPSSAAVYSTDLSALEGAIAAGETRTGILGYEVDQTWQDLKILFTPDMLSSDGLTFTAQAS